jgi:hypothetical protein
MEGATNIAVNSFKEACCMVGRLFWKRVTLNVGMGVDAARGLSGVIGWKTIYGRLESFNAYVTY